MDVLVGGGGGQSLRQSQVQSPLRCGTEPKVGQERGIGGGGLPNVFRSGTELPKSVRIPNLNLVFRVVMKNVYLSRQENTIYFI